MKGEGVTQTVYQSEGKITGLRSSFSNRIRCNLCLRIGGPPIFRVHRKSIKGNIGRLRRL